MNKRLFLFLALAFCLAASDASAQWASATTANNPVITGQTGSQRSQKIIPDGLGDFITVWRDQRFGGNAIFAQKLSGKTGARLWTATGVLVYNAALALNPDLCPDGTGGAYITFWDEDLDEVFVARLDAAGALQFTDSPFGAALGTNTGTDEQVPQICADGFGNAIVTFGEFNTANRAFAQKYDDGGGTFWLTTPAAALTNTFFPSGMGVEIKAPIVPDGNGGAIIVWEDQRNATSDIFGQHLTPAGAVAAGWTAGGTAICTEASAFQSDPQAVSNGTGGVIVVWEDARSGLADVYARALAGNATTLFGGLPTAGLAISAAASNQRRPQIASDGANGALITWTDARTFATTQEDIYAARVTATGTLPWAANGVPVCTVAGDQFSPRITTNGSGGAIAVWEDQRAGTNGGDIYAQHLTATGTVRTGWTANGEIVSNAANAQLEPAIAPDGFGGAVAAWFDARTAEDIYASQLGTYVVSGTGDAGDGTLRQAITNANANPGLIRFGITSAPPFIITPLTALPPITSAGIVVDGYTQTGASVNTEPSGTNAVLAVEVNCATVPQGLTVNSDAVVVRGLSFYGSVSAVGVLIQGGVGAVVEGCFIGLRANGTLPSTGLVTGINVSGGTNALIGSPLPAGRNLISNNSGRGILLSGTSPTVTGNLIGLDKTGETQIGAQAVGIEISNPLGTPLIGGALTGQGNVISGNTQAGIFLTDFQNATSTRIRGNVLGLNKSGETIPSGTSQQYGVFVSINSVGTHDNLSIGGTAAGEGNVISGNTQAGIRCTTNVGGANTLSNLAIQGNTIGTPRNGGAAVPGNAQQFGVSIEGGFANVVSGVSIDANNTIAYNVQFGIRLFCETFEPTGVSNVAIGANRIFANGTSGIVLLNGANAGVGVPTITSVSATTISGTSPVATGTIRIYTDKGNQGRVFLGQTFASGGSWTFSPGGTLPYSDFVTATTTDAVRTSAFSAPFAATITGSWVAGGTGIPPAINFNDVAASLSAVLAVGTNGRIYKTTDGGLNWSNKSFGSAALQGIAIPKNSTLARSAASTKDGTGVPASHSRASLQSGQAFGTAISCGVGGTILRSTDGGETWVDESGTTTNTLNEVAVSENFAARSAASTKDGTGVPASHSRASLQSGQAFGTAISCGVGGTILRSTDGGETWVDESGTTTNTLNGVATTDDIARINLAKSLGANTTQAPTAFGTAISCGVGGTILRSTDGGETWATETSGTTDDLESVALTEDFSLVAAAKGVTGTQSSAAPTASGAAIAVGENGTIRRSTDGGITWNSVASPVSTNLTSVQMISATEGYISGVGGVILKTTDAGLTWGLQSTPSTSDLNAIVVLGNGQGFAVGNSTTVFLTNNAGDTPLPVELAGFSGQPASTGVQLSWRTASESQNAGFYLWRSTGDGLFQLVADYSRVSELRGQGTSLAAHDYTYLDATVDAGTTYRYKLQSQDLSGTVHSYDLIVEVTPTNNGGGKAIAYDLKQNYPNPFNPATTIRYAVKDAGFVKIEVFNLLGQSVRTLVNETKTAGEYQVGFIGSELPSGLYFYRLTVGGASGSQVSFSMTKKMLLVK